MGMLARLTALSIASCLLDAPLTEGQRLEAGRISALVSLASDGAAVAFYGVPGNGSTGIVKRWSKASASASTVATTLPLVDGRVFSPGSAMLSIEGTNVALREYRLDSSANASTKTTLLDPRSGSPVEGGREQRFDALGLRVFVESMPTESKLRFQNIDPLKPCELTVTTDPEPSLRPLARGVATVSRREAAATDPSRETTGGTARARELILVKPDCQLETTGLAVQRIATYQADSLKDGLVVELRTLVTEGGARTESLVYFFATETAPARTIALPSAQSVVTSALGGLLASFTSGYETQAALELVDLSDGARLAPPLAEGDVIREVVARPGTDELWIVMNAAPGASTPENPDPNLFEARRLWRGHRPGAGAPLSFEPVPLEAYWRDSFGTVAVPGKFAEEAETRFTSDGKLTLSTGAQGVFVVDADTAGTAMRRQAFGPGTYGAGLAYLGANAVIVWGSLDQVDASERLSLARVDLATGASERLTDTSGSVFLTKNKALFVDQADSAFSPALLTVVSAATTERLASYVRSVSVVAPPDPAAPLDVFYAIQAPLRSEIDGLWHMELSQ